MNLSVRECSKDLLGSVQQSRDIKSSLEESLRIWPKTRYIYIYICIRSAIVPCHVLLI